MRGALPLLILLTPSPDLVTSIDRALTAAGRFLLSQQDAAGAFPSKTYGAFKDGRALTPIVLSALLFVPPDTDPKLPAAYRRGADFVASLVGPSGTVEPGPFGLDYPVYSSAGAIMVLSVPANVRHAAARDALVRYLFERQLTEERGWSPADPAYGGWGYHHGVPRKPKPGEPHDELLTSNLTSTLFAAGALTLAGIPRTDPRLAKALRFVERCQNFSPKPAAARRGDPLTDGGFFFTPTNDVQNKAGFLGRDAQGALHYRSYGTMTADGLRALIRLGLPERHPRVVAARAWLERNLIVERVPGDYPADRLVQRDSAYFYYLWTFTHAMMVLGHSKDWPERLVAELLRRQRPDGAFGNTSFDMREDDPLVATPLAAAALGVTRFLITREFRVAVPM